MAIFFLTPQKVLRTLSPLCGTNHLRTNIAQRTKKLIARRRIVTKLSYLRARRRHKKHVSLRLDTYEFQSTGKDSTELQNAN